jgi:phosphate transport system substrate-binding protein
LDRTIGKRLGALVLLGTLTVSGCSNAGATTAPSAPGATTAAPAATSAAPAGTSAAPAATSAAPAATSAAPAATTGAPSGTSINISGSSTVLPITSAIAEAYKAKAPNVAITVNGPGTGDGFKVFCKGETDISDASRKINDAEKATCQAAGIEFIELAVAIDGITLMTSNQTGDDVKCLTFNDLYALMGPESQGFKKWSDAQPLDTLLGSTTVLPAQDLTITAPGEESGTYNSFIEIALKKIADARKTKNTVLRPDYGSNGDDNVIIQGIASTPYSLGFVGFAYAQENADKVKELEVDGGKGCIAPSVETIAGGTYPLSRTLYIYVNKAKAKDNAALAPFVDYYLAAGTIEAALTLPGVGYINLPAATLDTSRATWAAH